jgi:hypothetical protein
MILQTTYRNFERSDRFEELVAGEAKKLERRHRRIVSCRVLIERPHQRRGAPFHVRIDLGIPGEELVISHTPNPPVLISEEEVTRLERPPDVAAIYKSGQRAVRDAFRKAERRLLDHVHRKAAG